MIVYYVLLITPEYYISVSLTRRPYSVLDVGRPALPAVGLQGGGRGKGKLQGIWGLYLDSLERRPIRTKSLSSGIISGTANFIEQATGAAPFVSRRYSLAFRAIPRAVGWGVIIAMHGRRL